MPHPETLDRLVRRVATQVRRRRIEHYALRGAFWGSLLSVLLLTFKGPLAEWALPSALGVLGVGVLTGALWGALKRTSVADAARLADRAWGLEDRVATAMDWVGRPERPPLVDALIADTLRRIERLEPRKAARRMIPGRGRAQLLASRLVPERDDTGFERLGVQELQRLGAHAIDEPRPDAGRPHAHLHRRGRWRLRQRHHQPRRRPAAGGARYHAIFFVDA